MELLAESAEGVGYLLKDRVSDVDEFAAAVRRVGEGGSALDPAIVSQLVGRRRRDDPLDQLTPREREVLEHMAQGRSNQGIADRARRHRARRREARDEHLREAPPPARDRGPPARARGAHLPAAVGAPVQDEGATEGSPSSVRKSWKTSWSASAASHSFEYLTFHACSLWARGICWYRSARVSARSSVATEKLGSSRAAVSSSSNSARNSRTSGPSTVARISLVDLLRADELGPALRARRFGGDLIFVRLCEGLDVRIRLGRAELLDALGLAELHQLERRVEDVQGGVVDRTVDPSRDQVD